MAFKFRAGAVLQPRATRPRGDAGGSSARVVRRAPAGRAIPPLDSSLPGPAQVLDVQRSLGNRVARQWIARRVGIPPLATPTSRGAGVRTVQRQSEESQGLTSARFAGDPLLQACFDDRARMTRGHRGASVQKVQQALVDLGYDLGPSGADAVYGERTWDAVKRFKANEALGFVEMGDVGPGTMHRLDQLFGSKTESPPKVADETALAACPAETDIVAALDARPDALGALAGAQGTGQAAGGHVSIADAVSRFKTKVDVSGSVGRNVSGRGQFFWVIGMHDAMRDELTVMSSDPTALAFVAKARRAREAIDDNDFTTAQRLIGELDVVAQRSTSPSKAKMQSLLRADRLGPSAIETQLWNALNADPANAMPSLAPFLSLRTLMQLEAFDKQSCGFAAHKIAERLLQKGGVTPRPNAKTGAFSADLTGTCIRDRRHAPSASSPTMRGDVVRQGGVSSAVAQVKRALDAGQLVHARVLSGVGIGTQRNVPFDTRPPANVGNPPEEHSLVIIGFDGDQFVFNDPDASVSNSPERGFGFLFFDASEGRLSTARDASDLVVDPDGHHDRGDKRYQVLTLSTF